MKFTLRLFELFVPFVYLIIYSFKYGENNQPLLFGIFAIIIFLGVIYNKLCELVDKK